MKQTQDIATFRWPDCLGAAALLFASVIGVAALSFHVRPGAEIVAVAFPPWWSTQRVFLAAAAADAAIVRRTAVPSILVVRPDDHEGMRRLHDAGVWLSFDPQAIAACFTK